MLLQKSSLDATTIPIKPNPDIVNETHLGYLATGEGYSLGGPAVFIEAGEGESSKFNLRVTLLRFPALENMGKASDGAPVLPLAPDLTMEMNYNLAALYQVKEGTESTGVEKR